MNQDPVKWHRKQDTLGVYYWPESDEELIRFLESPSDTPYIHPSRLAARNETFDPQSTTLTPNRR